MMTISLDRYFNRIGYNGNPASNLDTLRALHFAHSTSIPFENVDVLLGRGIRLDPASLQAKLIDARRGGYCFEQNGLFSLVLEELGFTVTRLSGRRVGMQRVLPRTHMILLVEADGARWLCDTGFGGWGLFEPLLLETDRETSQHGWTFSLRREDAYWVLQCAECLMGGPSQYAFTLEPHLPVDYEPANHYCATHPDSRFVQTLTAQLPTPEARYLLRNREFVTVTQTSEVVEALPDDAALLEVLEKRFGIVLPAGTVFGELPRTPAA